MDEARFDELFISELGWDNPPASQPLIIAEDGVEVHRVADKRGVGVWRVVGIPGPQVRRRIDNEVSRLTRERLIVYSTASAQLWMWPEKRPSGSGYRLSGHEYTPGSRNEALLQRLETASFSIDEESTLTVVDVLERVRKAFNADQVTKRFYQDFESHHTELLEAIEGIEGGENLSWYSSVLMNRLMFIYFMQKKGFLDDDVDYLSNRLKLVRNHLGENAFYGFFRRFLLPLFHDGLGSHLHGYEDPDIARIIGDVPYVNGGVFSPHLLEQHHDIDVPDTAFERIFAFFDRYQWHLDSRPTDDPNEINPDVLGYIFEQYINQKDQGAYYTKEDVTGYMAAASIIPAMLDRLISLPSSPWQRLIDEPSRYIPESIAHGADSPLPERIVSGMGASDRAARAEWSEAADSSVGLPGETWREVVARRERYQDLLILAAEGKISKADDAVTANVDLRRLIDDHLRSLASSEIDPAVNALLDLTVLDPTCGSGAFLFAALEIVSDCYLAVVDRSEELAALGEQKSKFLEEAERHPNRHYFVLKTALLRNLYGVDIMPEAGEIARLRLFLKLMAQLDNRSQIEPLPDLDFNIRTGNLVVGIASKEDAETRLNANLLNLEAIGEMVALAEQVADQYRAFLEAQRTGSPDDILTSKATVSELMAETRPRVTALLHEIRAEKAPVTQWESSSVPFHWFLEFPAVFEAGGFDVVIGNPPYINRNRITEYSWTGYATGDLGDIYAPCVERSLRLLNRRGRFAMILPISVQFSDGFRPVRQVVSAHLPTRWISTFSRNPAALFSAGLGVRSTIVVGARNNGAPRLHVSKLNRWIEDYRPHLFDGLRYNDVPANLERDDSWPRIDSPGLGNLFSQLVDGNVAVTDHVGRGQGAVRFKTTALYYLSVFQHDPPTYGLDGEVLAHTDVGSISTSSEAEAELIAAVLSTRLSLAWWAATADDFHVTARGLGSTPLSLASVGTSLDELRELSDALTAALSENVIFTKYAGKWMGNYDFKYVRHITDQIDQLVLRSLGLERHWEDLELFYAGFMKATGERPGTVRGMPRFV